MSDDLIRRLHKVEPDAPGERTRWLRNPDGPEAADRISALKAENERLRHALLMMRDCPRIADRPPYPWNSPQTEVAISVARSALAKDGGGDA